MALSLSTQHFRTGRNNQRVLVRETNYVNISKRDEGEFFAQEGKVYTRGGDVVENPPSWFWEQYATLSPEMKKIAGLVELRKKVPV